ncbi:MAG: hypothetical protein WDN75_05130 [Bacteroidota bacterium]
MTIRINTMLQVTGNLNVTGKVTGSKTKILDGSTYLWGVTYYDDKYRPVQTISTNVKTGIDHTTSVLDFSGRLVKTLTSHQVGSTTPVVARRFEYDHAGRVLATWHKVDNQSEFLLARNEYNELGQLVTKKLHASADPLIGKPGVVSGQDNIVKNAYNNERALIGKTSVTLQAGFTVPAGKTFSARAEYTTWNGSNSNPSNDGFRQVVDYRYNIRGWLTNINKSDLSAGTVEIRTIISAWSLDTMWISEQRRPPCSTKYQLGEVECRTGIDSIKRAGL